MKMTKKISIIFLSIIMLTLQGCGMFDSKIPELSDNEQAMVVEYATETLLHFDEKNGDKIKPSKKYDIIVEEDEEAAIDEEPIDAVEETIISEEDIENSEIDVPTETVEETANYGSIKDSIGIDGIDIEYAGYSITDYYSDGDNDFFVLNAQNGCKLLIIKFIITNISGDNLYVSMPYVDIRYKIELNGKSSNALTTLLLNDLALFQDDLSAGASKELVVVGEFPEEELLNIDTLKLIVKSQEENISIELK